VARLPKLAGMESFIVNGEEEAWQLLEEIRANDFNTDKLAVIKGWPEFHFKFWLDSRGIALTAPIMQAMLEYQTSINRAFMLVIEGTAELKGISEEERKDFEVIFLARRGSTDLSFNAQEVISNFMEKAIGKLTGKQITMIVLSFAVLWAGASSFNAYLEHQLEIAKQEASGKQAKDILDAQKFASQAELKRLELVTQVVKAARGDDALIEAADEGKKALLKAASKVSETEVAGTRIAPEVAQRLSRNARSEPIVDLTTASYEVIRVDTDVKDGFRVRLRHTGSNELVFASVGDRIVSDKDRELIKRGEWEKKPITVRLKEIRRRGVLASAQIEEVLGITGEIKTASN